MFVSVTVGMRNHLYLERHLGSRPKGLVWTSAFLADKAQRFGIKVGALGMCTSGNRVDLMYLQHIEVCWQQNKQ